MEHMGGQNFYRPHGTEFNGEIWNVEKHRKKAGFNINCFYQENGSWHRIRRGYNIVCKGLEDVRYTISPVLIIKGVLYIIVYWQGTETESQKLQCFDGILRVSRQGEQIEAERIKRVCRIPAPDLSWYEGSFVVDGSIVYYRGDDHMLYSLDMDLAEYSKDAVKLHKFPRRPFDGIVKPDDDIVKFTWGPWYYQGCLYLKVENEWKDRCEYTQFRLDNLMYPVLVDKRCCRYLESESVIMAGNRLFMPVEPGYGHKLRVVDLDEYIEKTVPCEGEWISFAAPFPDGRFLLVKQKEVQEQTVYYMEIVNVDLEETTLLKNRYEWDDIENPTQPFFRGYPGVDYHIQILSNQQELLFSRKKEETDEWEYAIVPLKDLLYGDVRLLDYWC